MELGYRYRVYPTVEQADALVEQMSQCRWVWNQARELRERTWRSERRSVGYGELCRHLTAARGDLPWLREGSCDCQQQALRELCAAYGRVFTARRNGHPMGLPGFRVLKQGGWRTVRYTRNGHRIDPDGLLRVAGVPGGLQVRWSRVLPSVPRSVTVTVDSAGRWHASFRVESKQILLPITGSMVGVDVGVACAWALSDGHREANPQHLRRRQRALARSQRALARKRKGSRNRTKAKLKVARQHAKVRDARRDFQHQRTTRLVRDHDLICVETLNVKGMTSSAKGTKARPGRQVRQKAGLNRAILDVGFSTIIGQLDYKTGLYGRELRKIDRWHPSSKTCSGCGAVRAKLPLSERTYHCEHCGMALDRDVNAARNILAAGLADKPNACGERVRPAGLRSGGQRPAKQEHPLVTAGIPHL